MKISPPTLSKNRSRCWFPLLPSLFEIFTPPTFFQKVGSGAFFKNFFFLFCWPQTWRKILSSLSSGLFHSLKLSTLKPKKILAKSFFCFPIFWKAIVWEFFLSLSPLFSTPPPFLSLLLFFPRWWLYANVFFSLFSPSSIPPLISSLLTVSFSGKKYRAPPDFICLISRTETTFSHSFLICVHLNI